MSIYDTIRCIWHDPAYVVRTHAENISSVLFFGGVAFIAWAM